MPKLPSPKDLAFWKKESDTLPPPPPSRHLSPSSIRGESSGQIAESDNRGIDIDRYRHEIDQKIDDIQKAVDGYASNGTTRSPYSMDESGDSDSVASFGGGSFKSSNFGSSDGFSTSAANGLSDAQKKFNAAIAGVEKSTANEDSRSGFKSPSELFSTDPSADVQNSIAKAKSDVNSGFKSSLAKVNNSLYDMNGNLTSATQNVGKTAENTIDVARQKFSKALGSMTEGARDVAKSSEQIAGKLKERLASATAAVPTLGSSTFKSPFSSNKSTAEEGIRKSESNVAGVNSGFNFPENAPGLMQSQGQMGLFDRTRVAEVTPVQPGGFENRSTAPNAPLIAQQNQSNAAQGAFADSQSKDNSANAGFKTASAQNNPMFKGVDAIPAQFGKSGNQPASHLSDVDLPAKLLKGSGIYAPGSVNLVR